MSYWQSVLLGIVEGLTEFLPVSSTGHLTIVEKILGLRVDDPGITAYTAVIQVGAIIAVLIYFRTDITGFAIAFFRGLFSAQGRRDPQWRFVLYVLAGSIPIGIVGLAGKGFITGPLRSLWVVGSALVLWSAVLVYAEHRGRQTRPEQSLTLSDALFVGVLQCAALIPGVSRSGATISAGLVRDLDRVAATRLSFFLSIPALVAAAALEVRDAVGGEGVGAGVTLVGTAVSFVVAYVSIAFLLRFVAGHSIAAFVPYRVAVGLAVLVALAVGALAAT